MDVFSYLMGSEAKPQSAKLCTKCEILMELYQRTPKADRDYWLMTELFVMLHGGDVCDKAFDGEKLENLGLSPIVLDHVKRCIEEARQ